MHTRMMWHAHQAATKANCIRRSVGAVLVRGGLILAEGSNGVAPPFANCAEAACPRCLAGGVTGMGYERCVCIHAEQQAIADSAARGVSTKGASLYVTLRPCLQCLSIVQAAGIVSVVFEQDWVYEDALEAVYQTMAQSFYTFGALNNIIEEQVSAGFVKS